MKIKSGLLSDLDPTNNIFGGVNNLHGLHHPAENYLHHTWVQSCLTDLTRKV